MPTPITHDNLGRGMDQFHPESRIPDGYWQDSLNGDPTPEGTMRTRKGYQRYAGSIPLRVTSVSRSGTNLDLSVDSSFDLTNLRSTPIIVYGRLSAAQTGNHSTTTAYHLYSSFTISSGKIRVTDAASGSYSDAAPQLVIYGIDWSTAIRAAGADDRWGWVNALDTYRSSLETRVVCGLGGNLFAAYTYAESGTAAGMPRMYPSIRGTASGAQVIGPAFVSAHGSRTRGDISTTGATGGNVQCTAAAYDSGSGYVDFTLALPSMAVNGTLGTIITADVDWLTVADMPGALNGTWLVKVVTQGTNALTIRCAVDDVTDSRHDVTGCDGDAGIFTDRVTLTATAKFGAGDRVQSTHIDSDLAIEVVGTSGSDVHLGGLTNTTFSVANAEVLYGTRTSQVLVPRDSGGTGTVTNLVRGDMLDVVGFTRRIRVVNVNPSADRTVNIAVSAGVATATITAGDSTTNLSVGDLVRLRGAGVHGGDVVLTAIGSSTTFSWETDEVAAVAGATCVGLTVGLDEEIELSDDSANATYLQPHARWIPLEWPTPVTAYVPQTKVRHLDQQGYDDQLFVRSAMMQDSLYFADGVHPILKFDGESVTPAGLPRWQPHLFTVPANSAQVINPIAKNAASIAVTGTAPVSTKFTCTAGEETRLTVGDWVILDHEASSVAPEVAQVRALASGAVELSVSGTGGTIYPAQFLKYYARYSLRDVNGFAIATAPTSHRDISLAIGRPALVTHTFAPFPRLGGYRFNSMDLEVYRTGDGGVPPYFRVLTAPVDFTVSRGYRHLSDSTPPALLVDEAGTEVGALDPVASALTGDELGTGWDRPPIGKYITSAASRLIIGNIVDYEQLDLTFRLPTNEINYRPYNSLIGKKFYLRKAGATGTSTNTSDVLAFQFVAFAITATSTTDVVSGVSAATDGSSFTVHLPSGNLAYSAGDWLQVTAAYGGAFSETPDVPITGWWQVQSVNNNVTTSKHEVTVRAQLPAPIEVTSINTGTEVCTTASAHGLVTGDVITPGFQATMPGGLSANADYFVIRVSATTLKLATTLANAQAGTAVNLTTNTGFYLLKGEFSGLFAAKAATGFIPVILNDFNVDAPQDYIEENLGYNTRADFSNDGAAKAIQFPRKLMHAINAVMSNYDVVQYPSFVPWLAAYAGNDYAPGQLVLRRLDVADDATTFEHNFAGGLEVYESGTALAASTRRSATRRLFPSRLCRSYKNYPEIFDSPYVQLDSDSDSAIDINPNDGDYLTGHVRLYGDSNFAQSAKEEVVIAAKNYSMYAVNADTKQVQQLITGGRGCTYPRSLQTTPDGVVFANTEGLWLIDLSMRLVQIGKYMGRKWRDAVQHDADPDLVCSHFSDAKWHVSVPVASETECDEVYVINTTEGEQPGTPINAWTRYSDFPATGWASAGRDVLFGTTSGLVCTRRRAGDETDARDDAEAIEVDWTYKPMNFGTAGLRKRVHSVEVGFRVTTGTDDVSVSFATDVVASFRAADTFELADATDLEPTDVDTNIDDRERAIVRTIRFTPPVRKANHQQLRIQCSAIDSPVEVVQFDWMVDPLSDAGVEAAPQTRGSR
jgi:hypothetical protein